MAVLVANTTVRGEDGFPVVLTAGSEVPLWAEDLVGEHLLTDSGRKTQKNSSAAKKESELVDEAPDFTKPARRRQK